MKHDLDYEQLGLGAGEMQEGIGYCRGGVLWEEADGVKL